jgi:hypothetical protein
MRTSNRNITHDLQKADEIIQLVDDILNQADDDSLAEEIFGSNTHSTDGIEDLHNALSDPSLHINEKMIQNKIINSVCETIFIHLLVIYQTQEYSDRLKIASIIKALILADINLQADSFYYANSLDTQLTCIQRLKSKIGDDLFNDMNQCIQIMQREIYPWFKKSVEEADRFKALEKEKLDNIKDPYIIRQFLLASEQNKLKLLDKKKQLAKELGYYDPSITIRFLLSSVEARKIFLTQKKAFDIWRTHKVEKPHYFQDSPFLAKLLNLPLETFQLMLKYLLSDPSRTFLFSDQAISAHEQENDASYNIQYR